MISPLLRKKKKGWSVSNDGTRGIKWKRWLSSGFAQVKTKCSEIMNHEVWSIRASLWLLWINKSNIKGVYVHYMVVRWWSAWSMQDAPGQYQKSNLKETRHSRTTGRAPLLNKDVAPCSCETLYRNLHNSIFYKNTQREYIRRGRWRGSLLWDLHEAKKARLKPEVDKSRGNTKKKKKRTSTTRRPSSWR